MLGSREKALYSHDVDDLNEMYDEGWEFVDSIAQPCATAKGDGYGQVSVYGPVLITVRRQKHTL